MKKYEKTGILLSILFIVIVMIICIFGSMYIMSSDFGAEFRAKRRAKEFQYFLNELEQNTIIFKEK